MRKKYHVGFLIMVCMLSLFMGCSAESDGGQDLSALSGASEDSQENPGSQSAGYITVAEAKTISLDNAGPSQNPPRLQPYRWHLRRRLPNRSF